MQRWQEDRAQGQLNGAVMCRQGLSDGKRGRRLHDVCLSNLSLLVISLTVRSMIQLVQLLAECNSIGKISGDRITCWKCTVASLWSATRPRVWNTRTRITESDSMR